MLTYKEYKQKPSDVIGVNMIKVASKLENVKERGVVNFKGLYSSILSADYKYPHHIEYGIFELEGKKVETIKKRDEEDKYALIQLHGGAYMLDFNDTYRQMALKYLNTGKDMKVYSLIYSLAPRHPFPEALNESVSLYKHILEQGYESKNIIIAGDSAGGGLALATGLWLKDNEIPVPGAIITMSAWTNLGLDGESHSFNKQLDPMFGEGTKPLNVKAYARKNDVHNPYISPKYGDYSKFTNLLMFVGGDELILSDTLDVAEAAKATNDVRVHNFLGMFHVFPVGFNKMSSSRKAWQIIKEYMNEIIMRKQA